MKKAVQFLIWVLPIGIIAQNALFIPDTLSGNSIELRLQSGQVEFYPEYLTKTMGYNQDYLGPTLILNKGQSVGMHVINDLSASTTLHWHGMHVSAKNDGGPHTVIPAGKTWSPTFTVMDPAATYWYHPHLHQHTEEQVTLGAAGVIIVRDPEERKLNLPRTYGKDDFPIVIQSRAFSADKQMMIQTAGDDVILCNGTREAYLQVPAQVVRLRLLNGSTDRVYNLGFSDDMPFYQIATDGGLLNAPVSLNRLILAPGERAELLFDLHNVQGKTIQMTSYSSELSWGMYGSSHPSMMPMGSIPGYGQNGLNDRDFKVMQLTVVAPTENPILAVPESLITNKPYPISETSAYRNLIFTPEHDEMGPGAMTNGPFEINDAEFDPNIINFRIPLNNTEVWELTNRTAIAHPFHIHDVQFYILDINGNPPPPNEQGRKDVVLVPPMSGTVRFITRFADFANQETPFMYHCHMLTHEDAGMMGQFIVEGQTSGIATTTKPEITLYPNPAYDQITVSGLTPGIISVYNANGQLLETRKSEKYFEKFQLSGLPAGMYFFKIQEKDDIQLLKVIKN
ncbi:MAG: multicopper oxidase domain-containing protein [Saprospiraceae bacterium]